MARRRNKGIARALTELEGAALSVIYRQKGCTPYRVRQDFLSSRSKEWSGSAGAVYPALRRMHAAGLVNAKRIAGRRPSDIYSLSRKGRAALKGWLADTDRASGSGLDPFRCRADYWIALPERERRVFEQRMSAKLREKCLDLERLLKKADMPEQKALGLELALHKTRISWLEHELGGDRGSSKQR
jgi:DNA-binding PadR family transcriptional regulator